MTTQARSGLVVARRSVAELSADPANARKHNERNLDAIKASLTRFGQQKPIVVDSSGVVRAGNGTLAAAKALGWAEIDVVVSNLKGAEATAYAIADNRTAELAEWDDDVLAATLQSLADEDPALLVDAGFTGAELNALLADVGETAGADEGRATLAQRFGVPPFSVLDARQGYWQDRKRAWLALGIQSELGRGGAPGGSPRPAAQLTDSGHTQRGDGRGKVLC